MKNSFESSMSKSTSEDIDTIVEYAEQESNEVLDQVIINIMNASYDQVRAINKAVLDRMKQLRDKDFSEVNNWTELYAAIASRGELEMAGEMLSDKEVVKIIDKIRSGDLPLKRITRTGGLRGKVEELLAD
ncbi:hypothetical protein GW933_03660 [Candidatus Falkowbacteria bacterium]|uniref:Uncharacterized protein n=1 Tax=Candidatus Buchananbacteria bacterium CG10_big_fil_rev_8_21_14_0_10_33_19 TaxID=1974525 RepID=A0A2H0W418_9BACT|nr:hypothetical protein [Candidatus Falkowbacteria bacterium]PIS06102.1 MAG: hypothetical protein COT80_02420 [Candidatus Buchananbacteria bacterium CG10_big_fil_rev_8_21_14_0_10_33_19]